MSTVYYGVDSVTPAPQLYSQLLGLWHMLPGVWVRYVRGQWRTDKDEVHDILSRGIRMAFVDNSVTAPGATAGDVASGRAAAAAAIAEMRSLGVDSALLFADIENDQVFSDAFGIGWGQGLQAENIPGGLYGNTRWDQFNGPYSRIALQVPRRHRLVWTSQPNSGYAPPVPTPPFDPLQPSNDSPAVGLQFAIDVVGSPGVVDLSVWSQEAYGLMAQRAPAPAPPIQLWRVTTPGALKSAPSHASADAIDRQRHRVWLYVGTALHAVGAVQHTDDAWRFATLVSPDAVVHGYYLDRNMHQYQ